MEVTPGYKQTEIGVFPADWIEMSVGDQQPFITSGSRGWARYYADRGNLFVRITNMTRETIHLSLTDCRFVRLPPSGHEGDRTVLQPGDVLVSVTADIGIISYVDRRVPSPAYINQHIALVRFPQAQIDPEFIAYFLAHYPSQRRFRAITDQGAKAGINLDTVRGIRLVIPPTKTEQAVIANALSDADALIESLEQLIAKKRDLKQAAMQELLTPKKGWVAAKLGSLGVFLKGSGVRKDDAQSGEIRCVRYGELYTHHNDYIKAFHSWISPAVAATARRLKTGDVLFAGSGETKEEIGKCAAFVADVEAYAGGDLVILRPAMTNSLFLGYYLNTAPIQRQKASKGQGDAVVHIGSAALGDIELNLPPIDEQTEIATILFDMDAEIDVLEAKLSKARNIKQGMMQELLTGRIRLV